MSTTTLFYKLALSDYSTFIYLFKDNTCVIVETVLYNETIVYMCWQFVFWMTLKTLVKQMKC